MKRGLLGDFETIAFEGDDLARMVGEDANAAQAEVDEDLRADAALALHEALAAKVLVDFRARVELDARERVVCFFDGRVDAKAAAAMVQVDEDATIFGGDGFQGAVDDFAAVAGERAENVAGQAMRVHANEGRLRAAELAANEGDVELIVGLGGIGEHAEIAEARGEGRFRDALHVTLMLHAIADQLGNRQKLQIVAPAKFSELRDAGHRAIVVHDFANHAGGIEARDASEIDGRLGLARADHHAAALRAQGKNVARACEVFRMRVGIDRGENRGGAIGGADASGGAAAGIDGFAEGRAEGRRIALRHRDQIQGIAALFGKRQANQAAAFASHEIHGFRSDFFGGHREVALVFAVFIVHEDNHAALADFVEGFLDRCEW